MEKKITKREMFVAIAEKYALTDEERAAFMANGGLGGKYDALVDRESAYEILQQVASPRYTQYRGSC